MYICTFCNKFERNVFLIVPSARRQGHQLQSRAGNESYRSFDRHFWSLDLFLVLTLLLSFYSQPFKLNINSFEEEKNNELNIKIFIYLLFFGNYTHILLRTHWHNLNNKIWLEESKVFDFLLTRARYKDTIEFITARFVY